MALRRDWARVLDAVLAVKKTSWVQLQDAQVASLEGRTLTLSFKHGGTMRAFQTGSSPDFLKDALQSTLGLDVTIECVLGEQAHEPAPVTPAPGRPAAAPAPAYDGFAPGDEAEPEDPDAPPPPDPVVRGEDAAIALVQAQLGGKVVGTIGDA